MHTPVESSRVRSGMPASSVHEGSTTILYQKNSVRLALSFSLPPSRPNYWNIQISMRKHSTLHQNHVVSLPLLACPPPKWIRAEPLIGLSITIAMTMQVGKGYLQQQQHQHGQTSSTENIRHTKSSSSSKHSKPNQTHLECQCCPFTASSLPPINPTLTSIDLTIDRQPANR